MFRSCGTRKKKKWSKLIVMIRIMKLIRSKIGWECRGREKTRYLLFDERYREIEIKYSRQSEES